MRLYIELRDRTRSAWTPWSDHDNIKFSILEAWNRWQLGASMEEAGNWGFMLREDISELDAGQLSKNPRAEIRRVEIHEISSILAMA